MKFCLNPYSNGTLPDHEQRPHQNRGNCLNPYSNGTLPDVRAFVEMYPDGVLILILMEHSLMYWCKGQNIVPLCLNPYSNGTLPDKLGRSLFGIEKKVS